MKTVLLMAVLAGVLVSLTGCETLADTKSENSVRVQHAMILDLKQVNNDVQYLLYLDRPVWLSRYPIPNN